jgi:hypothetical protein
MQTESRIGRRSRGCNKAGVCPQAASGCAVPMYNALELKSRRFRQHIAFYRNPRKGTHSGRQRGHPEASSRMRQLIPPIAPDTRDRNPFGTGSSAG